MRHVWEMLILLSGVKAASRSWQWLLTNQGYTQYGTVHYVCQRLRKLLSSDDAAAGCR